MKNFSVLFVVVVLFAVGAVQVSADSSLEHSRTTITRSSNSDSVDRSARDTSSRNTEYDLDDDEETGDATVLTVELMNSDGEVTVTVNANTNSDGGDADITVEINGSVVTGNDNQSGDGSGSDGADGDDGRDGTDEDDEESEEVDEDEESESENNDRYNSRPERDSRSNR